MNRQYILNPDVEISHEGVAVLTAHEVAEAMNYANNALMELSETTMRFDINIFVSVLFYPIWNFNSSYIIALSVMCARFRN